MEQAQIKQSANLNAMTVDVEDYFHVSAFDGVIDAKDWHTMDNFSKGSTLLVFSSEIYDDNDYIDEKY